MSSKSSKDPDLLESNQGLIDFLIRVSNPWRVLEYFSYQKKENNNGGAKMSSVSKKTASTSTRKNNRHGENWEPTPIHLAILGYLGYMLLFVVAWFREAIYGIGPVRGDLERNRENNRPGYPPLFASFESFYVRNVYRRLKDAFNQPIASVPGAKVSF